MVGSGRRCQNNWSKTLSKDSEIVWLERHTPKNLGKASDISFLVKRIIQGMILVFHYHVFSGCNTNDANLSLLFLGPGLPQMNDYKIFNYPLIIKIGLPHFFYYA